jgi:hypothetical protein
LPSAASAQDVAVLRPGSIINMISGNLSIMYGYKGPNIRPRVCVLDGQRTASAMRGA